MTCVIAATALMGGSAAASTGSTPSRTILVLGDSLSAEYGLRRGSGWVDLLARRLSKTHPQYNVANSSISGDTTSGGLSRLPRLLQSDHPQIVVIELGSNDGLRGLDPEQMRDNLQAMIDQCRAAHARVLLVGMHMPPNYGRAYEQRFFDTFSQLARRNRIALVPFLLDGFADRLDLFQADQIHPAEPAQRLILDNVWPHLEPLLGAPAVASRGR